MSGILSFGAYIPFFRLSRESMAKAWGRSSLGGERSVANSDEDTATMAVEAAFDCLTGWDRTGVDGLFFASTTSPYREKQIASLIATVVDLGEEITTADYSNCLRSGTTAIRMAFDVVKSGSARSILVTAAEERIGYPRSDFEQTFGDGAAAILLGNGPAIATVAGTYSIVNEMMDVWRNPSDVRERAPLAFLVSKDGHRTDLGRPSKGMRKTSSRVLNLALR